MCGAKCHTSEGIGLLETPIVLNVVSPDGRHGLSGKNTDYVVPEAMFLSGLRMLIPERAQWNSGVLQGQRGIPIFTDGSNLGEGTSRELGLELHFRLNDNSNVFQLEIFAILKAIKVITVGLTSDSESYMIFVDS